MTLLLLHPIGLDTEAFSFATIPGGQAIDLPGFGKLPAPAEPLDLAAMADDAIRRAPAGKLDVVGVSLGGMVALHIGLRHPDRVRSLVIAAAGAATNPELMKQRAQSAREGGMERQLHELLPRWFTPEALATPDDPGVAYVRRRLLADDPRTMELAWLAIGAHNVVGRLSELSIPITVIAGEFDGGASPDVLKGMAKALPNARAFVLPGAHMLPIENAAAFRQAVLDHLEWVESQGL